MKEKFYYKVVLEKTDDYESLIVSGEAEVKYKVNEFVIAPQWLLSRGYGLTVFKTLSQAVKWGAGYAEAVIFKVKVKKIMKLPKFCNPSVISNGIFQISHGATWPEGTVMVEEVMLWDEVEL